jgi:hypothetical protein
MGSAPRHAHPADPALRGRRLEHCRTRRTGWERVAGTVNEDVTLFSLAGTWSVQPYAICITAS